MSNKSPNVIYRSKFCLSLDSKDNYIKDDLNYKNKRLKDVDNMIDYFSNEKKSVVGMFEYYMGHTRGEHCNLVMDNGEYATKDDIKRIKNNYKKYIEHSNLWKGILSFNKDYINENIDIPKLEKVISKEVMPKFLKYCGFKDIKNMSYVFSIHNNTEHPHIHFAFIEKKPNFITKCNKINYRKTGKISKKEQAYLKNMVTLAIEREKYYTPMIIKTNEDIDYLKSYFNPSDKLFILKNINDIYIEEYILKLGELVKQYRNFNNQKSKKVKYNSIKDNELGKEIKYLTKEIKKYLFHDEHSLLFKCRKDINDDLEKLNNYFNIISKNNHTDFISDNSIIKKKEDYIDNYIYNSIVNHALYKYNHISMIVKNKSSSNSITIDDLIQEIAYQNSKNNIYNDKERRKKVLDNYFKNIDINFKFPSKYKLEKALKNINYEMEKASQEFSKLFNYEDKR